MIKIRNTENLAGVTISGDFDDLYNLVEAIYSVTIDELSQKNHAYIDMSRRVLGLCYELRHAYQGDREIELIENQMNESKMNFHSFIAPKNNVYYSCNYLYPEMFYIMLAINQLVELRMEMLAKTRFLMREALDKRVVWDDKIAAIRVFQAAFVKCVKGTLTENTFARWMNVMNGYDTRVHLIETQYLDFLNVKYIKMSKDKRLKTLSPITKRIVEYYRDDDYKEISEAIDEAVREFGWPKSEIKIQGIEYPENIEW
ncbi:DUF6904 family protein [Clostridium thermarum]|uniref:DUF6904 family protein n=1 Tax=Clostridium thermarum TaxID=1716543 RepID=UPI0013D51083|nr:hypothetical protein [Clostridium thermarum]